MKKEIIARAILIILALATSVPSAAADDRLPRGGAGYFMIGGSLLRCDGLNAALERDGYSHFPGSFLTLGGGGHAFIGRLVLGGEGQGLVGRRGGNGDSKTVLSGGCGFFNVGYVAHSGSGLVVYPLFGVGAGSVDLKIMGRDAASFTEVLGDPRRSARLQRSGFLMQLAIGADQWLGPAASGRRRGFFIGVRAGYVLAPVKGGWELDGMEVEGGPDAGWTGPYIRISIGAGRSQ
jgi:hypothetical protein